MNYGVNTNQVHWIYWTDNPDAFDANGFPSPRFEPNPNATIMGQFPNEGWYQCHVIKYKGNLESIYLEIYQAILIAF